MAAGAAVSGESEREVAAGLGIMAWLMQLILILANGWLASSSVIAINDSHQ